MTPPDPRLAQWCFSCAVAVLLLRLSWWVAVERDDALLQRCVFIAIIYAASGVLWFGGWMLAESKVQKAHFERVTGQRDFYKEELDKRIEELAAVRKEIERLKQK